MSRFSRHLIRHYERDPLARELERPALRPALEQRRPPLSVPEREASDFSSGGWSIGEPLFRDDIRDVVTQALDDTSSKPQARRVAFAPTHRVPQSDRRNYHPERMYAPALSLNGVPADTVTAPAYLRNAPVVFKSTRATIPCVMRAIRREVMFAKRKAGKGYKVRKRRTWMSDIPCL